MGKHSQTALYFTSVVVIEKDFAFFGGHLYSEKLEPSITRCVYFKDDAWGHLVDVDEVAYGASRKPLQNGKKNAYCVMGRLGHYYEYRVGGGSAPVDTFVDLEGNGYLMNLRYVGEHIYACGVQNQVFRQNGARWERKDQGAFVPLDEQVDLIFTDIHGFSEQDMYAVGFGGDLWRFSDSNWRKLESPTNYTLNSVLCAPDGQVYLGGGNGILFVGSDKAGWKDLSDPALSSEDIEDMMIFQNKIYIATESQLLSVSDGKLGKVDVPVKGKKSFYRMDAVHDAMWTVGDDCILQFDGSKWTRHICPENE